ncbi:MAG: metal-sensing transcriptional repressor [Lachnospiraceae bacterium]|nr:metal-sensing transcriptional repressor [Lachnospiraceae bacterium]
MHDHDHNHEQGHEHVHSHDHEHNHDHPHPHHHENTPAVLNRLSKAIGHLESVRRMVEDGRDCSEVLIQLAAVRSALGSVSRIILKDHIEHCVVDAVESHDQEAIEELNKAIDHLFK